MNLKEVIDAFEDCLLYTDEPENLTMQTKTRYWQDAIGAGRKMCAEGRLGHDEIIEVEEVRKELWGMFGDTPHAAELMNVTGKLYRLTHRKPTSGTGDTAQ